MTGDIETFVGDPPRTRWHRAWVVAGVTLAALVAAAAFRSRRATAAAPRPHSDQEVDPGTSPASPQ